ncbi:hypothetical protein KI387_026832, partial [Taxus chinensis]
QLLNVGHLIDKGTRITAKEAMEYWQQVLIDGVKDPTLLRWMATNLLRAQLSPRLGDTAAIDEVVKAMNDPSQSNPRLDTLKVAQIIGVQTVLLGASNAFAIHEDVEQLGFDVGLRLDQLWQLVKDMAIESLQQGKKINAICSALQVPVDQFEASNLANSLAVLMMEDEARNEDTATAMATSSSKEEDK